MLYVASVLLAVMVVLLITCGVLLWKRREETGDYSRLIQAILSWISAFFAFMFIFRIWKGTSVSYVTYLDSEHTFVPIGIMMTYFFYPLEVFCVKGNRLKVYAFLFIPLLMLLFIGLFGGIKYTTLYTLADLWEHIAEPNVWFRFFSLIVMLFYGFVLFLLPYDYKQSSVDRKFIWTYSLGFCLIGVLYFLEQMTHAYVLEVLHQMAWMGFFFGVAYYELKIRLYTPKKRYENLDVVQLEPASPMNSLWEKIVEVIEVNEGWRDPDLTLSVLTSKVHSNRTYVNEAFKRNVDMGFSEYVSKCRIQYVVEELKKHPDTHVHDLFFLAGFRSRSTASECFKRVMGMTLTEYLAQQKS
ncbi:MAG: helix-turn-helix domain-containing protein [Parabacteroides sp.]|nr:helix-turn-helix domain-containing protein [Parabacteroides sp.]